MYTIEKCTSSHVTLVNQSRPFAAMDFVATYLFLQFPDAATAAKIGHSCTVGTANTCDAGSTCDAQQYAPAMPASLGCWTVLVVSIVSAQYISALYQFGSFLTSARFCRPHQINLLSQSTGSRTARTEGYNYHFLSGDLPLDFGSFTVMVLQKHHLFTTQSEIFVCRICFLVITLAGEQRVEYKNKNE